MECIYIRLLATMVFMQSVIGNSGDTVTINTTQGPITGLVSKVDNKTIYQFRKIPYASSPVGNLRFSKPVPHPKWNETLDGTEFGPSCIQSSNPFVTLISPNKTMSEDCLFLNIYVPKNLTTVQKRSVMVWVHGGGYMFGSGMIYDGSYLALSGDVIVVTINYRLDIFGFLTTGKSTQAKGNYGLWDQIMALQWVHDNIDAFSGNPNSVTLIGQSAGAYSVGLQSLIPSNKGLFHRVILHSGVANVPLSTARDSVLMTKSIGLFSNCSQELSDPAFLTCMRALDAGTLMNSKQTILTRTIPDAIHIVNLIAPVIDNELIRENPTNILRGGPHQELNFFKSLDIMVGNCNQEATFVLPRLATSIQALFNFNLSIGIPNALFTDNIVKALTEDYFSSNKDVANEICAEYCVQNNLTEQGRQMFDMISDYFQFAPVDEYLSAHSEKNPSSKRYYFIFTRRLPDPLAPPRPRYLKGADHNLDILYLFNYINLPITIRTLPALDKELSNNMLKYWSNFVKHGDPNVESNLPYWHQFDLPKKSYQQLDLQIINGTHYNSRRIHFWRTEIPKLLQVEIAISSAPVMFSREQMALFCLFLSIIQIPISSRKSTNN